MGLVDLSRLALAFGASLVSYHIGGGPRPFSAAWAVTNRCNLRCVYCNTPFLDPTDLPIDRVQVLFQRLRELGVRRLGLAGGEPLIRRDIGELVDLAKSFGFFVTMNTNLVLYERRAEVFEDVDVVFTSLDGDAQTHLARRGEKSLDGVMDAIADLRRRHKPVVAIMVVGAGDFEQAEGSSIPRGSSSATASMSPRTTSRPTAISTSASRRHSARSLSSGSTSGEFVAEATTRP